MHKPDPVKHYLDQLEKTIAKISRDDIWSVIQELMVAWRKQKQIFLLGNGGSSATASHMANDLNKLTIVEGRPRFKAIALSDNVPLMTAWANDTDYKNIFMEQMLNFLQPEDVVIGISCSGNSGNVLRAFEAAKSFGAVTIAFTGDTGGRLKNLADHCILIPSPHIGHQEDGHMILDHVIANTLKELIEAEPISAS
ncbi:MAG: SIS domain-containing protein [Anaerolineales bacterium]|uniref:SIS domain-containing protein n=1 Tax=Candidatus Desulfolinea nitratireducens TaxID=2841698 RepID=A0A8J6TJ89_9CHLR|nr:SIS domain-containing protein [Candidatus Desulfolinea nitratireducens]